MLQIDPVAIAAGHVIADRYRLEAIIGEGGMGTVWEATDLTNDETRALKLVRRDRMGDARNEARLLREARALSAIRHDNVARLYEVSELDDGTPFFVMERLVGETLKQRLARSEKLSIAESLRITRAIAEGVSAAHGLGIVHRDLKPDNVFLGENGAVKVLDFGIAKEVHSENEGTDSALTTTGAMLGTLQYMAPEQVFGDADVDQRADVWSLGLVLYECLSGKRPTDGSGSGQVLKAIMTVRFARLDELVPKCPAEITRLVEQMLSRERAARPTMRDVCRRIDLATGRGDVATSSTDALTFSPAIEPATPRKEAKRSRHTIRVAGAVIVALAAIAFVATRSPSPSSSPSPSPAAQATTTEAKEEPPPPPPSIAPVPTLAEPPPAIASETKPAPRAAPPATAAHPRASAAPSMVTVVPPNPVSSASASGPPTFSTSRK